jgi:hypothetical protein
VQPGKTLLPRALALIAAHPAWLELPGRGAKTTKGATLRENTRRKTR